MYFGLAVPRLLFQRAHVHFEFLNQVLLRAKFAFRFCRCRWDKGIVAPAIAIDGRAHRV
jgi:hypothetical protein